MNLSLFWVVGIDIRFKLRRSWDGVKLVRVWFGNECFSFGFLIFFENLLFLLFERSNLDFERLLFLFYKVVLLLWKVIFF